MSDDFAMEYMEFHGVNVWSTRNGISEFIDYNSLTKEGRRTLNLRPENNFRTADGNFSYWLIIDDDGDILLYRSPIIAYITLTKPSNSERHAVLSKYDIELLREKARDTPWEEIRDLLSRSKRESCISKIEARGNATGQ